LAGLSPENVSQALSGALSVEGMKLNREQSEQQRVDNIIDNIYKTALTEQALATAERDKPSIMIPGTDIQLTRSQYLDWYKSANNDERTAAIKNYEYAQTKGYEGSFENFQDTSSTTHQKDYDRAKADGYEGSFNEWMLEMAKAGAINLSDIVERKAATADVEARKYFTDPEGLVSDVDKHVSSKEVRSQLFQYADDPRQKEIETVRAKEKFIRGKIVATGGKIVAEKLDGRNFVYTVKWPDGTTSEVTYAN